MSKVKISKLELEIYQLLVEGFSNGHEITLNPKLITAGRNIANDFIHRRVATLSAKFKSRDKLFSQYEEIALETGQLPSQENHAKQIYDIISTKNGNSIKEIIKKGNMFIGVTALPIKNQIPAKKGSIIVIINFTPNTHEFPTEKITELFNSLKEMTEVFDDFISLHRYFNQYRSIVNLSELQLVPDADEFEECKLTEVVDDTAIYKEKHSGRIFLKLMQNRKFLSLANQKYDSISFGKALFNRMIKLIIRFINQETKIKNTYSILIQNDLRVGCDPLPTIRSLCIFENDSLSKYRNLTKLIEESDGYNDRVVQEEEHHKVRSAHPSRRPNIGHRRTQSSPVDDLIRSNEIKSSNLYPDRLYPLMSTIANDTIIEETPESPKRVRKEPNESLLQEEPLSFASSKNIGLNDLSANKTEDIDEPTDSQEDLPFNAAQKLKETEPAKKWRRLSDELEKNDPYDDSADVEKSPKKLRTSHKNPITGASPKKPESKATKSISDDFIDNETFVVKKSEGVPSMSSTTESTEQAETSEATLQQEEIPFNADKKLCENEPAKKWRRLSDELEKEGTFDDSNQVDQTPKSLRTSHKNPITGQQQKKTEEKHTKPISDEFVDDETFVVKKSEGVPSMSSTAESEESTEKIEAPESAESVSDQQGDSLQEEPIPFSENKNIGITEPAKKWRRLSDELEKEEPYDDSADVEKSPKKLRSSHKDPVYSTSSKKTDDKEPKPISDEFVDSETFVVKKSEGIPSMSPTTESAEKIEAPESAESVSDQQGDPLQEEPLPFSENKNIGVTEPAKKWRRLSDELEKEEPYDDSADVEKSPKKLRSSHKDPVYSTSSKKTDDKEPKPISDEFVDTETFKVKRTEEIPSTEPTEAKQEPIESIDDELVVRPEDILDDTQEQNQGDPLQEEPLPFSENKNIGVTEPAKKWRRLSDELEKEEPYDDSADVEKSPKKLRSSHKDPIYSTSSKKTDDKEPKPISDEFVDSETFVVKKESEEKETSEPQEEEIKERKVGFNSAPNLSAYAPSRAITPGSEPESSGTDDEMQLNAKSIIEQPPLVRVDIETKLSGDVEVHTQLIPTRDTETPPPSEIDDNNGVEIK